MSATPARALEPGHTVELLATEWGGSETITLTLTDVRRTREWIYLYGSDQHGCSYAPACVPADAEHAIELRWTIAQTAETLGL